MNTLTFLIVFALIMAGSIIITMRLTKNYYHKMTDGYAELIEELCALIVEEVREDIDIDELRENLRKIIDDTAEIKTRISNVNAKVSKIMKGGE